MYGSSPRKEAVRCDEDRERQETDYRWQSAVWDLWCELLEKDNNARSDVAKKDGRSCRIIVDAVA